MVIACKDPDFAKKNDIDQETACEFVKADKEAGLWQKAPKKKSIYHRWSEK